MKHIDNWYEVRVDGEKAATFGPIRRAASEQAFKLIEDTRLGLYRNKVLQIVAVWEMDDAFGFRTREEVIHEEHPTVIEDEPNGGWPTCYDVSVL
tara:strand:+ start:1185 stop:1469 length:285 start_codon:yes stop_codon:yes gene_type:complete